MHQLSVETRLYVDDNYGTYPATYSAPGSFVPQYWVMDISRVIGIDWTSGEPFRCPSVKRQAGKVLPDYVCNLWGFWNGFDGIYRGLG